MSAPEARPGGDRLRRGLQAIVGLFGLVAVVAGLTTVGFGGASVVGGGAVSTSVDSELRFYGAWYAAAGALALRAVPRVEVATATIRGLFAVLFAGGVARLISIASVGAPHPFFLGLLVLELVLPALVLPWQAAVARRRGDAGGG